MSWMTWKAEVSDSVVQSTMVLREPIQTTEKWRRKKFARASRREISTTHLYTLPLAVPLQKYLTPALDRDECNTRQTTPKLNS